MGPGRSGRAYSRVCEASTAFRPVAVGVGGAERGAPMSQGAYRRVCGAATPKGAAQRGCSATGPALGKIQNQELNFGHLVDGVAEALAAEARILHPTIGHVICSEGGNLVDQHRA